MKTRWMADYADGSSTEIIVARDDDDVTIVITSPDGSTSIDVDAVTAHAVANALLVLANECEAAK